MTDSNTYFLFHFQVFLLYLRIMCVSVCERVAVNSDACYKWIVNDITDFNTSFF